MGLCKSIDIRYTKSVAKGKNKKDKTGKERKLAQETVDSIVAIGAFVLAIILILAWFGAAGRIGIVAYGALSALLGKGYALLPFALLLISAALLFSLKQKFVALPFLGALLFLLSTLGLLEISFGNGTGGLLGSYAARPLVYLFDWIASSIIFAALLVVSMLVMFNASLRRSFERTQKPESIPLVAPAGQVTSVAENAMEEASDEPEPARQKRDESKKNISPEVMRALKRKASDYTLPPLSILNSDQGKPSAGDIKANGNIIQRALQEFGIPVEMGEVSIGPSVTQYTLKPAQGIKLSRIVALQNDLALALAAHPIRIEAPIPSKSFVGIEIPNRVISLVGLRSLLEREDYQKGGPLAFALGKNVAGEPAYADLARMPHLLIAGSTGSGKSIAIHSILMSLLYKNTPLSLNLLLIDPKRVELAHYHDLPHLLTPVITEAKDAISALRWTVREMEERYKILQSARKRDIVSYNSSAEEFMPYIVIVIDELADLMAAFGREVEASVVRIAQMARAVGIHLIVSTQRPSVEVITGLIKANITSRIAFQVASQVDSRTILDGAGAEKLLGNGDMLYLAGDAGRPRRIQGAFVSDSEVKKTVEFILKQDAEPEYNEEILASRADNGRGIGDFGDTESDDELYGEAYGLVLEAGKASASYLQRRLKVGYARAARLLDMLEERGVIGPGDGAKPREILMDNKKEEDTYVS